MTPYYEQDGIVIFHGECERVLPTLQSFDLLLTDPPYGIGEAKGKNKSRSNMAEAKDYGTAEWDDKPVPRWLLQQAIEKARRAIVWGGNFYDLPASPCWLVWDKDNGANDFADCELAWTNFDRAVRRVTWRWAGMLQQDMANKEQRWHPTQKPEAAMLWALQQTPSDMTHVLDPFMGSGTVLVAAKRLGRQATGIEREERYCEIAAKRLQQGALPLEMGA